MAAAEVQTHAGDIGLRGIYPIRENQMQTKNEMEAGMMYYSHISASLRSSLASKNWLLFMASAATQLASDLLLALSSE